MWYGSTSLAPNRVVSRAHGALSPVRGAAVLAPDDAVVLALIPVSAAVVIPDADVAGPATVTAKAQAPTTTAATAVHLFTDPPGSCRTAPAAARGSHVSRRRSHQFGCPGFRVTR